MVLDVVKVLLVVALSSVLPPAFEKHRPSDSSTKAALFESEAQPGAKVENLIGELEQNEELISEYRERLGRIRIELTRINREKDVLSERWRVVSEEAGVSEAELRNILKGVVTGLPFRLPRMVEPRGPSWQEPQRSFAPLFQHKLYQRLSDFMIEKTLVKLEQIRRAEKDASLMASLLNLMESDMRQKLIEVEALDAALTSLQEQKRVALKKFLEREKGLARTFRGLLKSIERGGNLELGNEKEPKSLAKEISSRASELYRRPGRPDFVWPVRGRVILPFGRYRDDVFGAKLFNKGVKIRVKGDEPIQAIADGKVIFSGVFEGYGKLMILKHDQGFYSLFANLGKPLFFSGDSVEKGQAIALASMEGLEPSNGGSQDGTRVIYFELRKKKKTINPQRWIPRAN